MISKLAVSRQHPPSTGTRPRHQDPLLELFRSDGHELKPEGKNYKTRCPFHPDDTPSLSVDPAKGLWHCFGCDAGGDGITYLEKSLNIPFGRAADMWRELSGEEPKHCASKVEVSSEPVEGGAELTPQDVAVFNRLQEIYARDLGQSERALAYLEKRGITDSETIRVFGLGFVTGSGLPRLSAKQKARLQALGLLNEKENESFYGCIVCPLKDVDGQVVSFYGRRVLSGPLNHRTLSGPPRGFVHMEAARGSDQVVLVEGFLDAVACYQAGIRNVMSIGGCSVRPDLLQLLHREDVAEVLLCLDPDEAGDEGALKWAAALERRGIASVRVRLDYDPAEFFRRGGTAIGFRELAAKGRTLGRGSDDSEFLLDSHGLLYRARTCGRGSKSDKLKAQILVSWGSTLRGDQGFSHRDVLNLYIHKSRKTFANALVTAAKASGVPLELQALDIEEDLEDIIRGLEQRERQKVEARSAREQVVMSPEEQDEARRFLESPDLVTRLQDDMEALGYVGEEEAKLLVYLIATSRKLPRPLSGIIGSGSGAGKSFLAELAEQLTPPEEVELFSKLSSQALYYLPKDYLCRKLLILEERAGGEGADYAIRTLQTKDKLTQAVVLKDPATGRMSTKHYEVTGPIAYLETTTQSYLNPENTSRCFEIPLDESADQTRRIHQSQRRSRSITGLKLAVCKTAVRRTHHNAQRLLEPVRVVIPYAEQLEFPDRYLRTRRDHERFLSLIEVAAFLHQFQRAKKEATVKGQLVKYIEASVDDYALAYRLALRVLWVSLDELSRWSRELNDHMRAQAQLVVEEEGGKITSVTWTRRQLREVLRWPDKRLRNCLDELVCLEYLQILGGGKGKTYTYCLNPDFSHNPRALGLLTPEQLAEKLAVPEG